MELIWNMKSNSLATFRRRSIKRIKIFLICFALFSGALAAAESRYAIFRVYNITIEPQGLLSEGVVWGSLSSLEEKIWPLYWMRSHKHQEHICNYFPIKLNIFLEGWGKFRAKFSPLKPLFRMYWGGKYWYVSEDSRVWLTTLEENKKIIKSDINDLPILSWSSDRKLPVDLSNKKGNVMDTNLPIDRIEEWYSNIREHGLLDSVNFIQAKVKGDTQVVELFFNEQKSKGLSILFLDDPKDWNEPLLAIKKIYPNMNEIPNNIFIDTTYKGKILIQNKVQ